ncbi:MAG: polysaccharide deacetylase family protein [Balneolales bacterium]
MKKKMNTHRPIRFSKMVKSILMTLIIATVTVSCGTPKGQDGPIASPKEETWAEKLGFPEGKKVLIFHADDMGMSDEANEATKSLMDNDLIQSAAAMPPCPFYEEAINYAIANPQLDVGMHLALTSEWKTHRWGPVADPAEVPGLIDPDGKLWRSVKEVVENATPEEVEVELRAQIEKTLAMGFQPSHMDTHMGALFGTPDFTEVYLRLAEEYEIPAMIIDLSNPEIQEVYKEAGFPLDDRLLELINHYSMPKLDYFSSVPKGDSYEEVREKFYELVRSLEPGLTEIIFHPQHESEFSKTITNSWQQRAWEVELFADPEVQQFFKDEDLVFTDWTDLLKRFDKM